MVNFTCDVCNEEYYKQSGYRKPSQQSLGYKEIFLRCFVEKTFLTLVILTATSEFTMVRGLMCAGTVGKGSIGKAL